MNDLTIAIIVLFINVSAWFVLFGIQYWEFYTGRILPRKKHDKRNPVDSFLYIQDFDTDGVIGDIIALSLIDIATALSIHSTGFSLWMFVSIPVAILVTGRFIKLTLEQTHKPDWGFPSPGKVSWGGKAHLVYFFCQSCVGVMGLISIWTNPKILPVTLFAIGVVIYGIAYAKDYFSGKFVGTNASQK